MGLTSFRPRWPEYPLYLATGVVLALPFFIVADQTNLLTRLAIAADLQPQETVDLNPLHKPRDGPES